MVQVKLLFYQQNKLNVENAYLMPLVVHVIQAVFTKTNPNVGLDAEALSLATPTRNNATALVDYLKNPTTFDGLESIAEVHPSIASADIFPKMRSLTEEDLYAIAGHILLQPKVVSEKWGGGKIYY